MKTNLIVTVFALFCIVTSCTQEYSCQCIVKYSGNPPGLPDSTIQEFAIKNKKKQAKAECEANSITLSENGITMMETCRLF
jgi:hypothetical protein